jgi:hypothetical protein
MKRLMVDKNDQINESIKLGLLDCPNKAREYGKMIISTSYGLFPNKCNAMTIN